MVLPCCFDEKIEIMNRAMSQGGGLESALQFIRADTKKLFNFKCLFEELFISCYFQVHNKQINKFPHTF